MSEAVMNLGYEFGYLPSKVGCTCHAWIDLYYVPYGAWTAFSRAAAVVSRRTKKRTVNPWGPIVIWNELALPLIFHMAEAEGDCEPLNQEGKWGCRKQRMTCWGREGPF